MKKILVATDFTEESKEAIDYAVNLLKESPDGGQILLINTYLVQQTDPREILSLNDELRKRSKEGLELEKKAVVRALDNEQVSVSVGSHIGSLINVISNLIYTDDFDLVVMKNRGGEYQETIKTLMKNKKCPLLVF
jgi:nucleotide-binding universal stress UspA family protein